MNITSRTLFTITLLFLIQLPVSAKDLTERHEVQLIHNKGQVRDQYGLPRTDVDIKIAGDGVVLFAGSGQLHYQWSARRAGNCSNSSAIDDIHNSSSLKKELPISDMYRMDVELVGANKHAEMIAEEPTGYTEHYYTAYSGEQGIHTEGYGKVTYKDIWPGIDWVLYTTQSPAGQHKDVVKYDFVVHEGADPAAIRLRYKGATALQLEAGALVAETPMGTITEAAPYCYAAASGQEVASTYRLDGNELSFNISSYSGRLIIDPALQWATYFGNYSSVAQKIVTDKDSGYVYMYGDAGYYNTNIVTTGAHQVVMKGDRDCYLAKFTESGNRVWGTYYGGDTADYASGINIQPNGDIVITGETYSNNGIATGGSYQGTKSTGYDGFIARFSRAGVRQWASYYGGNGADGISGVCSDKYGNIYCVGGTTSTNGIASSGAHQGSYAGTGNSSWGDGYIVKFSPTGSRVWASYYGGTSDDFFVVISVSADGSSVYAAGDTRSSTGIATNGSYQATKSTSIRDGFLVKFNSSGVRQWGTYYGSNAENRLQAMDVAMDGNIIIGGITFGSSNMSTTGTHQPSYVGFGDCFLAKFSPAGNRIWGTYYGGTGGDQVHAIKSGELGNIYVAGETRSSTGIATTGAYKTVLSNSTSEDCFLSIFNANGTIKYGTYYGGASYEYDATTYVNYRGRLYLGGNTESNSGIATTGAYQTTYPGGPTSFFAAFIFDTVAYIPRPFVQHTDTVWCPGDTMRLPYEVSAAFSSGNDFSVELSDATGDFGSAVTIGTHSDTSGDTISCVIPLNTLAGTGYRLRIKGSNPSTTSWTNGKDIEVKAVPANFGNSSNTPVCTEDTVHLQGSSTSNGITWAWTGPGSFASAAEDTFIANSTMSAAGDYILKATLNSTGCSLQDTTTLVMKPTPNKPTAGSNSPVCEFHSLQLNSSSTTNGVSYSWTGPNSYSSNSQNPTVTTGAGGTHIGSYISTATLNGCSSMDTTTVVVNPKPNKPTASAPNSPLCARQDLQLNASTVSGVNYNWYGPGNYMANTQNPTRSYVQYADSGYYYVYAEQNACLSDTDSVKVTVNTDPYVNVIPSPGANICDGAEATFTAIPTNGGSTSYEWYLNGSSTGQTGTTYKTTTLKNGDKVTVLMTSTGTCATPFVDTSNEIPMVVTPLLTPSVAISANPNTSLFPNEPVTFTATPTDAGNTPTYQWTRNGQNVGGATGAVWGANANYMSDGDEICVVLTSSYSCPDPATAKSNCIKVNIRLSVEDITNSNDIDVYPNPVRSVLHIDGIAEDAAISLYDVTGRNIPAQVLITNGNATVDMRSVAAGSYVLRVDSPEGKPYYVKVVKE